MSGKHSAAAARDAIPLKYVDTRVTNHSVLLLSVITELFFNIFICSLQCNNYALPSYIHAQILWCTNICLHSYVIYMYIYKEKCTMLGQIKPTTTTQAYTIHIHSSWGSSVVTLCTYEYSAFLFNQYSYISCLLDSSNHSAII